MIDKKCEHVPKVLEIESKWEQGKVRVLVECTYCDGAGEANARIVFEEDINWMEPVDTNKAKRNFEEVPAP